MKVSFQKYSKHTGFEYLNQLADHVDSIGHVAMRKIGTIAGNWMLKPQHREFQSDLFLILETVGAEILVRESKGSKIVSNFRDFLEIDMRHKLIYSVVLPRLKYNYVYRSYKIMSRAQNAHAIVNAGFLFQLNKKTQVFERPNIIFGGVSAKFMHASKTEQYLEGKALLTSNSLRKALNILGSELKPELILPEASPEYRTKLAQFVLSLKPDKIDARIRSGGTMLKRPISSGKTDYNVDKSLWPVNKPIEAYYQTSGEAEYIDDIPHRDDEVLCASVLAPATGPIDRIDASEALVLDGVVAFYSAKDVPGKNITVDKSSFINYSDELAYSSKINQNLSISSHRQIGLLSNFLTASLDT
ncbi:indole-3-acetaldehyde oxidase-like [Nasonia vitripennis]|uniref:FAD-binding PCMH-type domain-containing protein n=1 Tax=Nasonia vitripennis TaxID=7425 RepID=A0A7M7QJ26_NASVI|nr:indole-3-acetaldehyde oxidase-like [Nasonia vitripennis]